MNTGDCKIVCKNIHNNFRSLILKYSVWDPGVVLPRFNEHMEAIKGSSLKFFSFKGISIVMSMRHFSPSDPMRCWIIIIVRIIKIEFIDPCSNAIKFLTSRGRIVVD